MRAITLLLLVALSPLARAAAPLTIVQQGDELSCPERRCHARIEASGALTFDVLDDAARVSYGQAPTRRGRSLPAPAELEAAVASFALDHLPLGRGDLTGPAPEPVLVQVELVISWPDGSHAEGKVTFTTGAIEKLLDARLARLGRGPVAFPGDAADAYKGPPRALWYRGALPPSSDHGPWRGAPGTTPAQLDWVLLIDDAPARTVTCPDGKTTRLRGNRGRIYERRTGKLIAQQTFDPRGGVRQLGCQPGASLSSRDGSDALDWAWNELMQLGRVRSPVEPSVELGKASLDAGFDPAILRRYLRRDLPAMARCRAGASKPQGTLELRFTIGASGEISGAAVRGTDDAGLERCLVDAVSGLRLPRPARGKVKVVQPITFH
jgi:hypothetical protein